MPLHDDVMAMTIICTASLMKHKRQRKNREPKKCGFQTLINAMINKDRFRVSITIVDRLGTVRQLGVEKVKSSI